MRVSRRAFRGWVAAAVVCAVATAGAAGGLASIRSQDLREWLTYVSSDELQGRAVFSAGFGLAAAYISDHLRSWGVKPAGDPGQYLQTVRVLGVNKRAQVTEVWADNMSTGWMSLSGTMSPDNKRRYSSASTTRRQVSLRLCRSRYGPCFGASPPVTECFNMSSPLWEPSPCCSSTGQMGCPLSL